MEDYLNKILDWQSDEVADSCDELSLWSSPFGMMLLDNFPIDDYENYLDVGFGTGFPLIEISQRLGKNCNCYGIDQWKAASKRAKRKIEVSGLQNITLIDGDASEIEFPDNFFDLITSNLGINNFENPLDVLKECNRVLKQEGRFCFTSNLTETFKEFYHIFKQTLHDLELGKYSHILEQHINHRGTMESTLSLIEKSGFKVVRLEESEYTMRYFNGSAFLNHSFTILAFLDSWRNLFDEQDRCEIFEKLEINLNEFAKQQRELRLTIPMIYVECKKLK